MEPGQWQRKGEGRSLRARGSISANWTPEGRVCSTTGIKEGERLGWKRRQGILT